MANIQRINKKAMLVPAGRLGGIANGANPDDAVNKSQLDTLQAEVDAIEAGTQTLANLRLTDSTASTSSTSGAFINSGGAGIAGALYVAGRANTANHIVRPTATTVAANTGTTLTAAMMLSGYVMVTGTTGSLALDSVANLTTALGTSPEGTSFEFTLNTMGATPMTAGNVLTLTAPASCVFRKQFNTTDAATVFVATVTATAGVHIGTYRVTYDTATTISVTRIG